MKAQVEALRVHDEGWWGGSDGVWENNIFFWNLIYYLVLLGIIPIIPIMFDIPMIYGVSIGNSNRLQDGFSIHRKSESQF